MMQAAGYFLVMAFFSMWGALYIGSLAPRLWSEHNYRGAIGVSIIAIVTFVAPALFTLLSSK